MMTYQEQIKHPKWQKKRLQVLQAHKFTCQYCGTKTEELHVHHPYYKRGAMIWEYKKEELECLCHRCHKDAHAIDEKIKKALALCREKEKVLDFILSLNGSPVALAAIHQSPHPVDPSVDHRTMTEEEEDAEYLKKSQEQDERFYAEYPQFRPSPDDTSDQRASKFFAKMKWMMG